MALLLARLIRYPLNSGYSDKKRFNDEKSDFFRVFLYFTSTALGLTGSSIIISTSSFFCPPVFYITCINVIFY